MKTHEILTLTESELAPKLKQLKVKELERHAQKILKQLGQTNYDQTMSTIIKAIPNLDKNNNSYQELQLLITGLLSSQNTLSTNKTEIISRVTVIIMLLIAKKFDAIHNSH